MKRLLYIIFLLFIFQNCTDDPVPNGGSNNYPEEDNIGGVYVGLASRASDSDWNVNQEYIQFEDNVGENEEKPYIITHFRDSDILFISQMGTTVNPALDNMQTNENAKPNYNKNTVKDNLYVYMYKTPTDSADWNRGSNFVPYINEKNDSTPMNWSKIKSLGSVGNAFSFYALFQGNNETPNTRTVAWMNYSGLQAQYGPHSAEELGKRYGLYGAYHATSSLYTRMRFRMYPLFNMIQVTLLVPVQKFTDGEPGYTGFGPNAFKNNWNAGNSSVQELPGLWFGVPDWAGPNRANIGTVKKISSSFDITWRSNISSDNDAPVIQPGTAGTNTSFYLLRYDKNNPDAEHPAFELKDIKSFYPQSNIDTDTVRRYEFLCYYVPQTTFTASSYNTAILSMRLLTPNSSGEMYYIQNTTYPNPDYKMSVRGTYVNYFFYGNTKGQSQLPGQTDLNFNEKGVYQHLTLYVPRYGNEAVFVSAKVVKWKDTYTDMTVTDRDEQ